MKILLGTHYLAKTGGTESYTYALAMELKRLGHQVEYFTFEKGEVSDLLEKRGIPFMSAEGYDLILANHNTVVEKLWNYGFLIQTRHGYIPTLEQPSPFADAYVSISEEVKEHLFSKGFTSEVLWNGIDCNRFFPKKHVAQSLTTVLSLCHSDIANDFVRRCCERIGVKFIQSNKYTDNVWAIEDLINESDLVIGLGRSAYDAMACGRCVLVYDYREYMGEFWGDGMLTPESVERSMLCNCSGRSFKLKYDEMSFIAEMQKYSPELAAWSREFALKHLNIKKRTQTYLNICNREKEKVQKSKWKLRLKIILDECSQNEHIITEEKVKLQEQNLILQQEILTSHQQLADLQNQVAVLHQQYTLKGKKHLRAIRFLMWLNVLLLLLILYV